MPVPPQEFDELGAIARSYQRSRALTVVAELGVADLLRNGPRSVEELAAASQTHEPTLYRLLRALSSIGVFHEDDERRFALTAMGEYLRTDHPFSLAPVARMFGADYEWKAWGELMHSVRTGENAAPHALGTDVWEYRRQHPADGEVFDSAMRTMSYSDSQALLSAYDFGRHSVIADIGGGTGAALASILQVFPRASGILFDQSQVVASAAPLLRQAGVSDRVTVVPGNFFESIPSGADAYLLRRILHDWLDEEARTILLCVRRAMDGNARLLVVDAIVGPPNEDPRTKFLDLLMLVSAGGRERTEPEWRALLAAGSFQLVKATRVTASSHVIEAIPR